MTPDEAHARRVRVTDGARGLYAVLDLTALTWSTVETIPSTITDASDQHAQHTLTRIVLGALAYVMSVESAATRRPADRPRRTATITPTPTAAYASFTFKRAKRTSDG